MKRIGKERMITRSTMGLGIAKGIGWALAVTAGGGALMASLILRGTLRETAIGYAAMIILLLASFAGSKIAVRAVGKQLVPTAFSASGGYFLTLVLLNALLYKGDFEGVGVTMLVIFSGAGVTILTGMNKRETKRRIRA